MGCNCKRKIKFEEKYGEKIEEGVINKIIRLSTRVVSYSLILLISIILFPIVFVIWLYTMLFSKDDIIKLPKFITRNYYYG